MSASAIIIVGKPAPEPAPRWALGSAKIASRTNSTTKGTTSIRSTRSIARCPNSGSTSWTAAAITMSPTFSPVEVWTPALDARASPARTTSARPSVS